MPFWGAQSSAGLQQAEMPLHAAGPCSGDAQLQRVTYAECFAVLSAFSPGCSPLSAVLGQCPGISTVSSWGEPGEHACEHAPAAECLLRSP